MNIFEQLANFWEEQANISVDEKEQAWLYSCAGDLRNANKKCCNDQKIININAKCGDLIHIDYLYGVEINGYVPDHIGIGNGDYIRFEYCINCGKIVGDFPIKNCNV